MSTKRYEFTITLSGYGQSPGKAWDDAIESFTQDPGGHDCVRRNKDKPATTGTYTVESAPYMDKE